MISDRYQRAKQIYYQVCDLAPDERVDILDRECRSDADLRREIDRLLNVDGRPGFLDQPVLRDERVLHRAVAALSQENPSRLPTMIGRYRIVRLIGEGGMGRVYEAEQDSPRRTVALKVIRAAQTSANLTRRFEHEIEILGRLHHPGIAQIFDAGMGEVAGADGVAGHVAYFAMEFVDGTSVIEHARNAHLNDAARLELLAKVADAIQYGHQRGVTHRDLKPGNVLVDSSGHPKVIDFGVAKITDRDAAFTTMQTNPGQMLGTLAYMSPEQVSGQPHSVDMRSDIYSLGVIGYELISGKLPYEVSDKLMPEAARVIRDEEPSRLSSNSLVYRGDIETIIAKALEKEPDRRYQSAAELASDIRRYLNDEPIVARPPSLRYQLGKFTRRHKELVAGLVLVFVVLVAGIIGTSVGLIRATSAREDAVDRQREAERQARLATQVADVLTNMLGSSAPGAEGGGRDIRVADLLDRTVKQINSTPEAFREIEADLRLTIGKMYQNLAMYKEAEDNLQRARQLAGQSRAEDDEQVLMATALLAATLNSQNRHAEAGTMAKPALTLAVARYGREHEVSRLLSDALTWSEIFQNHFDSALALNDEALAGARSLPPSPSRELRIAALLRIRGGYFAQYGRHDTAVATFKDSLEIEAAANPGSVVDPAGETRVALAAVYLLQGLINKAADVQLAVAADRRAYFGPTHPQTIQALERAALLLAGQQRNSESLPVFRELWNYWQSRADSDPVKFAQVATSLASCLAVNERFDESYRLYEDVLATRRRVGGDSDVLAQQIWRAANGDLGVRSAGDWTSQSIRRAWRMAGDSMLLAEKPPVYSLDYFQWPAATYRLEQWRNADVSGSEPATAVWALVGSGPLSELRNAGEPEDGIHRLTVEVPRKDREPLQISVSTLNADWKASSYSTKPDTPSDPEKWRTLIAEPPHRSLELRTLHWRTRSWDACYGPDDAPTYFGIVATADIALPAGRYHFLLTSDDGVRGWIDDQPVINSWWGRPPTTDVSDVTLPEGAHHFRVEYFQAHGTSVLMVQLVPIEASPGQSDR